MPDPIKKPHLFIREKLPEPAPRVYEVAGGGGTYPREDYKKHANKIFKEASQLRAVFAKLETEGLPEKVYFRAELPKDFSTWSGKGTDLEKNTHSKIVGSPEKNVGYLSTTKASFDLLYEQLERYNDTEKSVGKSNFAALEKISEIPSDEKITDRLKRNIGSDNFKDEALISLFPDLTQVERETYKKVISQVLAEDGGKLTGEYLSDTGLIIKIKANKKSIKKIAERILAVQSVDSVDELIVPSATVGENIENGVIVDVNQSTASVCIFDSGLVQGSRFIDGSIIGIENPLGPPLSEEHGTFVASRIIYGDTLRDQVASGKLLPDTKVLSVCLFPHDGIGNPVRISTEKIMETIRITVERWHERIRVYNLSLNLESPDPTVSSSISDDTVNPLAAELDNLAKKFDVIFVVSSGNYPTKAAANPTEAYPEYFKKDDTRICPPAESNLAITVGSLSQRANGGSMAQLGLPSPFTRKGPGFSGYRKPDLIAHGGNFAAGWRSMDDLSVAGISKDGRHLAYGNGTSFSAPIVSRLAAHLFAAVPGASSSLVRAMLIHFASLPKNNGFDEELFLNLTGNGFPQIENLLSSNQWQQSFLYQGEVDYRKIHTIPFYVPEGLVKRKGRGVLGVRVTIAFNSETDRTLKSGYCKTHLRTNVWKIDKAGKLVGVGCGDGPLNVNDMYSTVIRRDHKFMSGVQHGDWAITLEQITRWNLKDTKTKFGMVLTIIDPKEEANIDIATLIQNEVPNRYKESLKFPTNIRL